MKKSNVWDTFSNLKHWFQFADDTAIATTLESDNQHLCNVFLKWTSCTDLTIKVSEC